MIPASGNKLSLYAYLLSLAVICYVSFFFYPRWKEPANEAPISWDVSGYYWYLPSVFIYKDLKHQSFKDSVLNKYKPTYHEFLQGYQLDNGNYVMKYSSGMAIMYLPFFATAHVLAKPLGYPRDGFSRPYQVAMQMGGLLVSLLGLWYLRKLLLMFYEDATVAVTLLLIAVCSNYLNYSAIECGMLHCWLFTLYVFLLLNIVYFYRTFEVKYAARIGLLVGLATLARPTEVISCLIPLLWGTESLSLSALKRQAGLITAHFKPLLIACVCAIVVVVIQPMYWKYVSGHWLVYSYQDQHLEFAHPYFMKYTFGFRSGWLIYSPVMLLAFLGIIPFIRSGKNKVAILAFFLLNYYVVSSWSVWWFGGRAMIQSYPILAFPMAAFVHVILRHRVMIWLSVPVALLILYYNSWVTYIYHKGDIWDNDCMSGAYLRAVAGRWNVPPYAPLLKENPDMYMGVPVHPTLVYTNDFVHDTGALYERDSMGKVVWLRLDKEHQNSPVMSFAFSGNNNKWLRTEAIFKCNTKEWDSWKMTQFIVRLTNKGQVVKENMERVYRVLGGHETRKINLDMKMPKAKYDSVKIFFWNGDSEQPIWIDSLKVCSF